MTRRRGKIVALFLAVFILVCPFAAQAKEAAGPASADGFTPWTIGGLSFTLNSPTGIVSDSQGNIYIANMGYNRILKVSPAGTVIREWGSYMGETGTDPGKFNVPFGIAVDSTDNIYVVDKQNCRIQKFDSNGNFLLQWGSNGDADGQFWYPGPEYIAIDKNDKVYVADKLNSRIQVFDKNGNFVSKWGTYGTTIGKFYSPSGITFDSAGNIYVGDSDTRDPRVQKFSASDHTYMSNVGGIGTWDGAFTAVQGMKTDAGGNLYVVDKIGRVEKFGPGGNYVAKWGLTTVGHGELNEFYWPMDIAIDPAGNIYVTDTFNNRIMKMGDNVLVTYNPKNGGASQKAAAARGSLLTKPADPVRTGYVFAGWYKDEAYTSAWNFTVDTVSDTMTLYAKWTSKVVLSGITVSAGTLSPAFKPSIYKYTLMLDENTPTVKVTPKKTFSGALMKINGTQSSYKTFSVGNGKSTVMSIVLGADGQSKTYSVTIKRKASTNNYLSSITASRGTLSPKFSKTRLSYTLTLPKGATKVTVKGVRASSLAVISPASKTYDLASKRSLVATIKVTSQAGKSRSYTIKIVKK